VTPVNRILQFGHCRTDTALSGVLRGAYWALPHCVGGHPPRRHRRIHSSHA